MDPDCHRPTQSASDAAVKVPNEKEEIVMFRELQSLGEQKFRRIAEELKRGMPVMSVAALIQQQWGDCHDLPENKLAEQLKSLRAAISNGASGGDFKENVESRESVRMKLMQGSTPSCLDQLVELALIERQRMLPLWEREKRQDSIIPELTAIMKNYAKLLVYCPISKWH
jgi:hypothetical protein